MSLPQSQKHTPADSYKDQYEWYGFDREGAGPDEDGEAEEEGAMSMPEEREKSFRKRLLSDSVKEGTHGSQQFEEEIKHKNKLLKNIQNAQKSITAFEQDLIERSERLRSQRADQSLQGYGTLQKREGQITSQQNNKQNPAFSQLSGHLESKQNSNFYPIDQVNSNRQTTDRGTIQSASEMGTIRPSQMMQSKTQDYQIHLSRGINSNPAMMSNSESLNSLGSADSNLKVHPKKYDTKKQIARNGAIEIYNDHQPGSSAAGVDVDVRMTTQSNEGRTFDNSRNYNRRSSHTDMEVLNDPGKIEAQVRGITSSQGGTDRVNIKQAILKKPYQSPNDSNYTQVQMSKQNSSTYLKMRQNSAQNVKQSDIESQARQSAPLRQPSRSPSQKSAKTHNTGHTQFSNQNNNQTGVAVAVSTPQQPYLEANFSQNHFMMLNSDSTKISGLNHEQSMSPTRNHNPGSSLQRRAGATIQETNAEQDLDTSHEESQVLKQPLYYMQPAKGDQLRYQQQYRRSRELQADQVQMNQQNLILEEDSSPTNYKESRNGHGSHVKYNTMTNGAEKFVFNSNVLNSDGGQDVQQQQQQPVGHTEPFLWSYDNQELLASQKQSNHDMKDYIMVEQEPSINHGRPQASGHHTGGSFGNLGDFQRQMGMQNQHGSKATTDHARSNRILPEHVQTLEQDQQQFLSHQELSRQQQTHQQSRGILSNMSPMRSRKQAKDSDENSTFIKIEQMIQKQDEGSKGRQDEEGSRKQDYQVRQAAAKDGSQRSQHRNKPGDHSERSKVRIVCDTLGNRNDNIIYTVDSSAEFKKRKFENLKQGSQAFRSSKSRQRKEMMKKDLQKRRGGSSLSNQSHERAYSPDKPFSRSNIKKSRVLSTTRLSSDNDSYSQSETRLHKSRITHSQGRIRHSLSRERMKFGRKQHTTRAQTLDRPDTALIRAEIYKYFLENKPSPEKRLTREKKSLSNKSMPSNNQRSRSLSKRQTKAKNHERCKSQNKERKTNKSSGTRSQKKGNTSVLSGKQPRGSSLTREAKPPRRKNLNTIASNLNTIDPKAKQLQSPIDSIKRKQSASNFHKHRNSLQTPSGPSLAKSRKASQTRPTTRKSEDHSTKDTSADGITSDSLAQKLLTDIATKYRNMERANLIQMKSQPSSFAGNITAQLNQKNQMFQDIQSLAQALIKAEKKLQRQKADSKQHIQKLKAIIEDQEQCMQLMQEKIQRLVQRGNRVERHEQKARREHSKDREKLTDELEAMRIELDKEKARRGLDKAKWDKERKDIIIGMEKELQSMQLKVQKKCDLKVNSLQGINDHLNVKIQELIKTEQEYQNVKKEYDQSIVMLNEQQERLAELGNINEELKQQNQHLSMRQERSTIEQTEQCVHLRKQIEQMHAKYEQKIRTLKEQHHNEVQKYKISQVMNDFSKRYQFEDKISDQELLMKQLNDQNASKDAKIQDLESQLQKERGSRTDKERQMGEQLKVANQKNERVKIELNDLQSKVTQLQKQIEKKERVLEELKQKEVSTQELSDQAIADKDQKINNLQQRLDSRNDQLDQLRTELDQKERENQDERNQKEIEVQTLKAKIELQQQEITILAQGFQAQQQKLKTFSNQGSARHELESLRSPNINDAQMSSNSYYPKHVMAMNTSTQQTQILSSDEEPYGTRQLISFGNHHQQLSSSNKQEHSFNKVLSLHPTFTDPSSMTESGPQAAEYFQDSAAKIVLQQNAQDQVTRNQSFQKNTSNASSLQSRHSQQVQQIVRRSNEPVIQDNYQELQSIEVSEPSLKMRRGGNPTFSGSQCAQILDQSSSQQEQKQPSKPNAQALHSPQPISSNEARSHQRILVQEHTLTSQATTSTDLQNVAQNDQLNQKIEQKDQEIQILWSVISQIQQQQQQMQNGSQHAQLQQMMQSAMNNRQADGGAADVTRGGGGSNGHIDQQYLQRFMSSNSPSHNDYYQTSSSGPHQVMISDKNHEIDSDTIKPSPHHITSTKSPNIYVNTDSGAQSHVQSSRQPLAIPSQSTHHLRHQSNQSDQPPAISMMHTGSINTVNSMNVLSERVNNAGSAIGHGSQLQRLGRQGFNGEKIRFDTKSDNTIIERRGEENSEQRDDRQDGKEGEDEQHSDVSSTSDLSQRAKDIHQRKKGHHIQRDQVRDQSVYDEQVHVLDGQIDSLLDSKLSLNSQSRQDLADVKKRISKLLHEPRKNSHSTSRSPKVEDTRTTTGFTQRQYGK